MTANIYLDNAATTPARPEVVEAMLPLLGGYNPSSLHAHGRAARRALDDARAAVAAVLGAAPREIVFTGSGSEADVLAIVGAAKARAAAGRHVITSAIEHHAVLHAFDLLAAEGWGVTRLPVGADGLVAPAVLAAALRPGETTLVSIMLANNEVGTIQPLAELAGLAHAAGALVHTDAVATAGYLDLDLRRLAVDLLTLSAHKFNGPKGVGLLFVRRGTPLASQVVGGGQEHGLRAGTENLAGIAGLARALSLAASERDAVAGRIAALRDRLAAEILARVPGTIELGARAPRVPHILSLGFAGQAADALLIALDLEGVSASAGSACAAGSLEPSHVVAALGVAPEYAAGVVRFSLGRSTTAAEIDMAAEAVGRVIGRMQASDV